MQTSRFLDQGVSSRLDFAVSQLAPRQIPVYPIGWQGSKFKGSALFSALSENQNNASFNLFINFFIDLNCISFGIIFRNKVSDDLNYVKKNSKITKISKRSPFKH